MLRDKRRLTAGRLHGARHGHATEMMKNGVHSKVVSERLGHANIRITLDVYSHVPPGIQESASITFEKAMDEDRQKN
jgi:integrase